MKLDGKKDIIIWIIIVFTAFMSWKADLARAVGSRTALRPAPILNFVSESTWR